MPTALTEHLLLYKRCLYRKFYFYCMIFRKEGEDSRTSSTPNTSEPLCRYGSYGNIFFFSYQLVLLVDNVQGAEVSH